MKDSFFSILHFFSLHEHLSIAPTKGPPSQLTHREHVRRSSSLLWGKSPETSREVRLAYAVAALLHVRKATTVKQGSCWSIVRQRRRCLWMVDSHIPAASHSSLHVIHVRRAWIRAKIWALVLHHLSTVRDRQSVLHKRSYAVRFSPTTREWIEHNGAYSWLALILYFFLLSVRQAVCYDFLEFGDLVSFVSIFTYMMPLFVWIEFLQGVVDPNRIRNAPGFDIPDNLLPSFYLAEYWRIFFI